MKKLSTIILEVTEPTISNNKFYGNIVSRQKHIEEHELDKIENVETFDKSLHFFFEYRDRKISIKANKYAFSDLGDGLFYILAKDDEYLYDISVWYNDDHELNASCEVCAADDYDVSYGYTTIKFEEIVMKESIE